MCWFIMDYKFYDSINYIIPFEGKKSIFLSTNVIDDDKLFEQTACNLIINFSK